LEEVAVSDDRYRSEIFISEEHNIGIAVLTNINDMKDCLPVNLLNQEKVK
jgi:hypothetical protein